MSATCPVCHAAVPWHRLFRTTAWSSWRCDDCGSLLTINVRRRFMAAGISVATVVAMPRLVNMPPTWEFPIAMLVMVAVLAPYFIFFEQLRVVERRGFRCTGCGYDLRGQASTRCSECGQPLTSDEVARMCQRDRPPRSTAMYPRRPGLMLVLLILAIVATVAAIVGTARYRRGQNRSGQPTMSVRPATPVPTPNLENGLK